MNYDAELNKGMKVFSQLYVGVDAPNKDGDIPLGFATPYEDNAAGRKRQSTVDNWLHGRRVYVYENGLVKRDEAGNIMYQRSADIRIVDNIPRSGFIITDDIKRTYWGGGNVVWRVADPAGFELEIQSQNLMAIIQTCGIQGGGLLPGKCIWGRDGGNNILLHESSEEYKNAIVAAETIKAPSILGKNSRVIGSKYLMQDGSEAVYLGSLWAVTENTSRNFNIYEYFLNNTFKAYDAVKIGDRIKLYAKAPLVRVLENVATDFSVQQQIDSATGRSFASSNHSANIVAVSINKPSTVKYVVKPVSEEVFNRRLASINVGNINSRLGFCAASYYLFGSVRSSGILWLVDNVPCEPSSYYDRTANSASYVAPIKYTDAVIKPVPHNSYGVPSNKYIIPSFLILEDMINWYKQQFTDGKLVQFDVEIG